MLVQLLDIYGNTILEENGEEMFTGLSGSVIDYQILQNADNPIIIWSERRNNNNYRIFLQILNGDGSNIFVENGIPITANANFYLYDFEAAYGENSGTIALVWAENRLGYQQIFAQGIDTSGNLLWADSTGICLTPVDFESIKPKISLINNFGTDEYYIGWEDYSDFMDSRITGQKIVNGNLEWGTEGKVIADRNYNDELTEVIENYYIWQSVGYNNQNIFCLMVDENGDPATGWPEDGLEVCVEDGVQKQARGIITPQGLFVLWEDYRNGDADIYGQIVTPDGNILWQENGLPLVTQENDQDDFKFIYDDRLYIVWQDSRSSYYPDIYLQKFDLDGNELWQEGGILVAEASDNGYYYPDLVKVGSEIIIVWGNYNDYNDLDIYSQLVSDDGELLWQLQDIMICDEIMDQTKPIIVSNGNDDAYISWIDHRSTIMGNEGLVTIPGIYAQKLHLEPTYVDEELVEPIEILSNYPNPFNPETTIYFETINLHELAQIEIYNVKGQKIKQLEIINLKLGINNVVWDGNNQNDQPVASGIYFYQLNVDNKIIASKKCLLLK